MSTTRDKQTPELPTRNLSKNDLPSSDTVRRFFFDDCDARGEIAYIDSAYQSATQHQKLDTTLQQLLGEFFAAASVLVGVLKFKGKLTIQAQGNGMVRLLMADITDDRKLRGVVRTSDGYKTEHSLKLTLPELLGEGTLSITIEPDQGQRYQGIVPLDHERLADNLSAYFSMSEQLPTFIYLCADKKSAAGILAQAMPTNSEDTTQRESWDTVEALVKTITAKELLTLSHEVILQRLFSELQTRVSEKKLIEFKCSCSREKSSLAITSLGLKEATELLVERDLISIHCEFCGKDYSFGPSDLDKIFNTSDTKH